jgi:hypothetical protein
MRRTLVLALIAVLGGVLVASSMPVSKSEAAAAAAAGNIPADYTGKPFKDKVNQIPGTIQAEDYDTAPGNKEDITFHYKGGAQKSDYRPDSIRATKFGGGHVGTKGEKENPDQIYLGWTQDGEWMKYTVHVAESATYKFGGKLSAAGKDGKLSVVFTPTLKISASIPTTAGFQPGVEVYHVWLVSDNLGEVTLPAGDYVMQITLEKNGGCNMDYFTFTKKP